MTAASTTVSSRRRYAVLLRYARGHAGGWALILVVTLANTAAGAAAPLPLKVLVDNVLDDKAMPSFLEALPGTGSSQGLLAWVVAAGLLIFALDSAFDVTLTYLWIRVGQSMVFDLARDLFARIQRRSLLFHVRHPVGDSMARVAGDSWCVHTVVDQLLFTPVTAIVSAGGMILVMAKLDTGLTVLSLMVVPVMTLCSLSFGKPIRRVSRRQREVESAIHSHVQRTLSGVSVVQAFAQEEREHRGFQKLARAAIRSHKRGAFVGGLNGLGSGLITTLGKGAVLLVGARSVLNGSLSVGSLLVFISYVDKLQADLGGLTGIYSSLQGARGSMDRVMEVLDATPEVSDRPGALPLPPVEGHVRLEGVSFSYEEDRPVLEDVYLEAHPGQVVAIVGSTGAGKSTLVSLVPRFFDPRAGRVSIDGHDVRDVQLKSLRSQVALVLQESFLFPMSIADNIAYGRPEASRAEVEAAARAANIASFVEHLPEGYDTVVGERGATLSGGERQRVAIARALLKDAPILILDEPTSALDAQTEDHLLDALDRLMAGRTTLVIAHRLSTIRKADRIVVLEHGRVAESGSHDELLARDGVYANLHRLQTGEARHTVGAELS